MVSEQISAGEDVFVLGAGFSKAIHPGMPLLRELSQALQKRLAEHSSEFQRIPFIGEDIELALTYMYQRHPWLSEAQHLRNRALAIELSQSIAAEVREREKAVLCDTRQPPTWLVRLVHLLHRGERVVITLNYDTLLERAFGSVALDECDHRICDEQLQSGEFFKPREGLVVAGRIETAELLKLHGSCNWAYSGRASYFGELISRAGTRGWKYTDAEFNRDGTSGLVPLIVPPVTDKGAYFEHEGIRFLWEKASGALRRAARVFCIGYSLPITDLPMRFLFRSSSPGQCVPLYVVNTDPTAADGFRRLFNGTTFKVETDYVGPNAVCRLADKLMDEDIAKTIEAAPVSDRRGPVEQALRERIAEGEVFQALQRDDMCQVSAITERGLTLRTGAAAIPVQSRVSTRPSGSSWRSARAHR